jgi:hypothetical protein
LLSVALLLLLPTTTKLEETPYLSLVFGCCWRDILARSPKFE